MGSWLLASVVLLASLAGADSTAIKVIAHSSVKVSHLSLEDLKGVFLETKTSLADGSRVAPVLLKPGGAHSAFVRLYTGKTTTALENYYRSLVFTGKGAMPKILASDEAMVAYVKNTKGAIGYVSVGATTEGVNVLDVK